MIYGTYTDIWLNSPIKCHSTSYYRPCASILAHRTLSRKHEFLMHKLYMHKLLKSSYLLKNDVIIKVCLGLPSAQSNKIFHRTHIVAIIPRLWRLWGFSVPVFGFPSNVSAHFRFVSSCSWKSVLLFSQMQRGNALHQFSAKFFGLFLNC